MGEAVKAKRVLTREEKAEKNRKRLESYNPIMAARNALRREFSRSPIVIEMMNDPATSRRVPTFKKDGTRSKVDAREHLCAECKEWKRSAKGSKASIDHIDPVVCPQAGFIDLNTYYSRMWVPKTNLQKLCGDCHNTKTQAEWFHRRFKEEQAIVEKAQTSSREVAKKLLKRFTPKKLSIAPYPQEFIARVENLKSSLKGAA